MSDPKRKPDEHRDLSAVRAVAGEDETRDDTPEVEQDDGPDGARRDGDPSRDSSVEGTDEPYDTDDKVIARARQNTEDGRAPGTIHDPNSVTTGTEVEPDRD